MKRIINITGLCLLAAAFLLAIGRIAWREVNRPQGGDTDLIEIRLAHWQLETGMREALDSVAREYMRLNPGVRVTQIPIPERIYRNWLLTQLIGGTAPDIIQVGIGITNERLARYFIPLTEAAKSPNPHNQGTPLEGVALRETFFDGMEGGFNKELLEYYGIPTSGFTVRLYINLDLLREITGGTQLPQTFQDLMRVCEQTKEYSQKIGQPIIPIAGSRYNAPVIMQRLFSSQTQRLNQELGAPGVLQPDPFQLTKAFVEGRWSLDSPEIQSGLQLMREVGKNMQPGFMQVTRDDASFYFMQGKALMIASGSWDASSIHQQAKFPFRAVRIPLPTPEHPEFGLGVLGAPSEADSNAGASFGITASSPHPEVALDFLLFLSSQPTNEVFARESGWLPAITGIPPPPVMKDFIMQTKGDIPGFSLVPSGWADSSRLFNNAFHRLVAPEGSVEEFTNLVRPYFPQATLSDLDRQSRTQTAALRRMDVQMAAWSSLDRLGLSPTAATKIDMAFSALNQQDRIFYQTQRVREKLKAQLSDQP